MHLHELGWELNGLMIGFAKLLEAVDLRSIPIEMALDNPEIMRGMHISFDQRFRTKNIRMPSRGQEYKIRFVGDLKTDPHIYIKVEEYKVVAYID